MRYLLFVLLFSLYFSSFAQKLSKKEVQLWENIQKNNTEQVEKLLKKRVNPDVKKDNYYTPLYWALRNQKFELAELLLKYKAKIDAPIYQNPTLPQNATLLMLACSGRNPQHLRIAEFLIQNGANPNLTIKAQNATNGFSALEIAIFSRNYFVVKLLAENGANLNRTIKDNPRFEGFTPLGITLNQGVNTQTDEDIITVLLKNGAKVKHIIPFQNGNNVPYEVLFFSVSHHYSIKNTAKKLQEKGANFNLDVNLTNYEGRLFPFVAKYNTLDVLKTLTHCKVNPNTQAIRTEKADEEGFTALHFAIQKQNKWTAQYLLNLRVDTTIRAKNGKTALDLARENGMINQLYANKKIITQNDIPRFKADSLLQLLPKSIDSKKVDILNELGKGYKVFFQIEEAEKYLNQAVSLAQKLNYQDGLAVGYKYLSSLYREQTFFQQHITKANENLYETQEKYYKSRRDTSNYIPNEFFFNVIGRGMVSDIYCINNIEEDKFLPEFASDVTIKVKRRIFNKEYWKKHKEYDIKSAEIRMQQTEADNQVWGIKRMRDMYNLNVKNKTQQEKLYLKWLKIRKKENNTTKTLWILKELTYFYLMGRKYEKADTYIQETYEIYQETNPENIPHLFIKSAHQCWYLQPHPSAKFDIDSINQIIQKQKFIHFQKALPTIEKYISDDSVQQVLYRKITRYYEKDITENRINIENKYLLNQYISLLKLQNNPDKLIHGYFTILKHIQKSELLEEYLLQIPTVLAQISNSVNKKLYWVRYANFYQNRFKNFNKALEISILAYDKNILSLSEIKVPLEELLFLAPDTNKIKSCLKILDNFLEKHNNQTEKIWAFRLQSRLFQQLKNYPKSAETREQIFAFTNPNDKKILKDLADAGFLFQLAKNQDKAIRYFNQALEITQKYLEFENQVPLHHLKIAYCYESFVEFKKAEKAYIKAFETARKNLGQSKGVLKRYINNLHTAHDVSMRVSRFYANQGKKKKALKYAQTSLKVAKALPNKNVFNKAYRVKKSNELIKKIQ